MERRGTIRLRLLGPPRSSQLTARCRRKDKNNSFCWFRPFLFPFSVSFLFLLTYTHKLAKSLNERPLDRCPWQSLGSFQEVGKGITFTFKHTFSWTSVWTRACKTFFNLQQSFKVLKVINCRLKSGRSSLFHLYSFKLFPVGRTVPPKSAAIALHSSQVKVTKNSLGYPLSLSFFALLLTFFFPLFK